jgi:protein involved in polysaccharide export with SLBB domain
MIVLVLELIRTAFRNWRTISVAGLMGLLASCSSTGGTNAPQMPPGAPPPGSADRPERSSSSADLSRGSVDVLRVGDALGITYSDFPGGPLVTQQQIREDGKITLHLGYEIKAAGENRGELEKKIRRLYIDEKQVYRDINISLSTPMRYFSVGGEVRSPGSFSHPGEMTLTKAINTAGGLTDFADKRKIIIIRASDRSRKTVNYKSILKNPRLDEPIFPGDQIHVNRSIL